MITGLLYFFIFLTWSVGILCLLCLLSIRLQQHKVLMNAISGNKSKSQEIPEELKSLMERSPGHPEVEEIEGGDEVFGIIFKSESYPPTMEESNDED
jgi:hypothetical protein